jgi:DNA polymerase-3 subunit delta
MTLLARLRAQVERGNSVDAVMASSGKSLFWKEKGAISRQLGAWRSEVLGRSITRLVEVERQLKSPGAVGSAAVEEELFAICRQAARRR